jgi:hypothetical protein
MRNKATFDPAQFHAERRILYRRLGIGLAAFVLLGLVTAQPLYRMGKRWRARQLALMAESLEAGGRLADADTKVRAAFQLAPNEPDVLRSVAHLQRARGDLAGAVSFWEQLKRLNAMTPADRQEYAEDLFRTGRVDEAETENELLQARNPNDPATLRLAARIAAARQLYPQSLEYARRAQQVDPGNGEGRLLLALLDLTSPGSGLRRAGLDALVALGRDRDESGLEALVYLAAQRDLPPADIQAIIPLLKDHPLATENQRLMALDLEIGTQPSKREALIEEAFAAYKGADPVKRRAFAVWLNAHGEYERTLVLIPRAEALTRKDLLLVYLDALAALKRWGDIEDTLGGENVPLDGAYTELFRARSAIELGEPTSASLHWTRAFQAAAPSTDEMWFLGNYAEKIGQTDQAEFAYQSLKSNATTARPAYEALLRLAEEKGDDDAMLQLLREMVQRWPHDDAVANDYTYFSLLKGQSVQEGLKTATDLVNQFPASLAHRTTLALAFYRMHDGASAMNVYAGLQIPWERVPASHRAVYAAVLGLAGHSAEARAQANAIRLEDLRSEEKELIKPWRSQ